MIRARATARCAADLATLPLEVTATLADKLEQRLQAPESGELIDGLRQRSCYSLHTGRYRAATWYDIEHDVLWLLAAGIHISGDRNDFYNIAVQWERSGLLYPTSDDYQNLENDERRDLSVREAMELRLLRDRVVSDPNSWPSNVRERRRTPCGDLGRDNRGIGFNSRADPYVSVA